MRPERVPAEIWPRRLRASKDIICLFILAKIDIESASRIFINYALLNYASSLLTAGVRLCRSEMKR